MKLSDVKTKAVPVFRKFGVNFAGVFGSVARGQQRPDSDVDFLVQFEKMPGLVQFIRLEDELKNILKTKVDVVVKGSEKSLIKPAIEKDLIVLYGQR